MSLPQGDSWDLFRAAEWDDQIQTVGALLGVLGAGNRTAAQQAETLRAFMQTAPYQSCPPELKAQIGQFLDANGGAQ